MGTIATPYIDTSMKKCSVIYMSSVASCGRVANSSSASARSLSELPYALRRSTGVEIDGFRMNNPYNNEYQTNNS